MSYVALSSMKLLLLSFVLVFSYEEQYLEIIKIYTKKTKTKKDKDPPNTKTMR